MWCRSHLPDLFAQDADSAPINPRPVPPGPFCARFNARNSGVRVLSASTGERFVNGVIPGAKIYKWLNPNRKEENV